MEKNGFSYWKPTLCCNKKSKSGHYCGIFGICSRNSLAGRVKCSWKDQMLAANDLNPSPCPCEAFAVRYFSNVVISVMEILIVPFLIIVFPVCFKEMVCLTQLFFQNNPQLRGLFIALLPLKLRETFCSTRGFF